MREARRPRCSTARPATGSTSWRTSAGSCSALLPDTAQPFYTCASHTSWHKLARAAASPCFMTAATLRATSTGCLCTCRTDHGAAARSLPSASASAEQGFPCKSAHTRHSHPRRKRSTSSSVARALFGEVEVEERARALHACEAGEGSALEDQHLQIVEGIRQVQVEMPCAGSEQHFATTRKRCARAGTVS